MKKKIAILIATLILVCSTVGSAITPTYNLKEYYPYGIEATNLSLKISKLKDKYNLKYKDDVDLTETCYLICQHSKYSKFNKYDVASIILSESKFDQFAHNQVSGAKGLGQLHNARKDYKDELPWLKNEYNKNQNILASIIILQDKLKGHNKKYLAYVKYNGKVCDQSLNYGRNVQKLSNEIKNTKI